MRLNVFLQQAGVGSRREAERLVEQGRIKVNGVVATPTVPVNDGDKVEMDGKPLSPATRSQPRLFLLYKPLDFLVTAFDKQGRPNIYDLPNLKPPRWDKSKPRVIYVGRLDVNSEGLLVLSSDGPLAQTMMSPETALPRVYRVRVHGRLTERQVDILRRGVTVEGVRYRGVEVTEETGHSGRTNTWYRVTLTEGKNREIRRLFEHFGCVVNRLIRVQYGPFHLGKLERGDVVEVPATDVKRLMQELAAKPVRIKA
ncbi:MAG: rRNA pseudouridine synthase [Rhizobiales bacterium]|nr:rRNA pseudouridine synthase [Hyphomicrobiales bacterium]